MANPRLKRVGQAATPAVRLNPGEGPCFENQAQTFVKPVERLAWRSAHYEQWS